MFGLERERALSQLTRSAAILALVLAAGLATFVVATFAAPAVPSASRPRPIPTVSLLTTPASPGEEGSGSATATALEANAFDGSGCLNPDATLTSPTDGESISGVIELIGTANIINFAFYKYEFRTASASEPWRAIGAGTLPIVDNELGTWDTSLVPPDSYVLQLVVTDTLGNAPLPCIINVRVVPTSSDQ